MLDELAADDVDRFAVLSGDSETSVQNLCHNLGIGECHGNMKPTDKLSQLNQWQQPGHRIAMFGDGINDAPVLASANVSIAFSNASDLAKVSSDFIILGDDSRALVSARNLAKRTRRNIMQNFGWALGYNALAIPFAAAGFIPPWGAAIGMSLSSLVVVVNALRLESLILESGGDTKNINDTEIPQNVYKKSYL